MLLDSSLRAKASVLRPESLQTERTPPPPPPAVLPPPSAATNGDARKGHGESGAEHGGEGGTGCCACTNGAAAAGRQPYASNAEGGGESGRAGRVGARTVPPSLVPPTPVPPSPVPGPGALFDAWPPGGPTASAVMHLGTQIPPALDATVALVTPRLPAAACTAAAANGHCTNARAGGGSCRVTNGMSISGAGHGTAAAGGAGGGAGGGSLVTGALNGCAANGTGAHARPCVGGALARPPCRGARTASAPRLLAAAVVAQSGKGARGPV